MVQHCMPPLRFARPGDSGSLVFSEDGHLVGLLGGSEHAPDFEVGSGARRFGQGNYHGAIIPVNKLVRDIECVTGAKFDLYVNVEGL
jgi:hypothetical protein